MLPDDARALRERAERLFAQKRAVDSRDQEIAENFYVERADFTARRSLGADYAGHLTTGYPAMVRRQLGDAIGSMLRPRSKAWFAIRAQDERAETHEARAWLQWATGVQRRAMADRISGFARATKEGDHDFAAFGACAISVEPNRRDAALLARNWHLRDMAWAEDAYGQIGERYRRWKPTAAQAVEVFAMAADQKLRDRAAKEPHSEASFLHCVVRADMAEGPRVRTPWLSLWIDCEHDRVVERRGSWTPVYVIPRWMTVSGSQYAYSPAAVIALPDARLLQAMTLTLLEAGEKVVNPPLIGVSEAIRGDVNAYPGGFTAVDAEYDERLGEVLRPMTVKGDGLGFGLDMADRTAAMLREAFFINALALPVTGPEMTAFEVGQRVQDYIRQAMPLFEPMEADYNGALCETAFDVLMREGAFGPPDAIPRALRGGEIRFTFESPLTEAVEREKGQVFLQAKAIIAEAVAVEPTAARVLDFAATLRDTLQGIGVPAKWMRSEEDVAAQAQGEAARAAGAGLLGELQAGADVAATLGGAARDFAAAEAAA